MPSKKRQLNMMVRIVPSGTLPPNPNNPHVNKSPEQRQAEIIKILAKGLSRIAAGT
jgi:hypothetical protein